MASLSYRPIQQQPTPSALAARVEGIGSCWIGLFDNDAIKELLDVPPDWNVAAVMPMGIPKADPWGPPAKRKPIGEITAVDLWS